MVVFELRAKLIAFVNSYMVKIFNALLTNSHIQEALSLSSLISPSLTFQTYSLFLKSGHSLTPTLSTALIHRLSSSLHHLPFAHRIFLDTPLPDLIAYNALLAGYSKHNQVQQVFDVFTDLVTCSGFKPDAFTLSSVIKCSLCLDHSRILHCVCFKLGCVASPFVVSGLVGNYMMFRDVGSGEKCFDACSVVDNSVLSVLVSGFVWNCEYERAKQAFKEVRRLGLELNEFTLTGVLGAVLDVGEGKMVHGISVKMGLLAGCSAHLNNALMNVYIRCECDTAAVKVFEEMKNPDVVSWTERIDAAHDGMEGLELFNVLRSQGYDINEYTLINLLSVIGFSKMFASGMQIQGLCVKAGYMFVTSVGNAFIHMYGRVGRVDESRCVFSEMICTDLVSWNSLINGYSEKGCVSSTLLAFSDMRSLSVLPNKFTLASVLEVVSDSSLLQVEQIHSYVIKLGCSYDDSMVSCLITAYGKSNKIDHLNRVFNEINKISVVHLNTMVSTLVNAGHFADALKLFVRSRALSTEVDSTTHSIAFKAVGALSDLEKGRSVHSLVVKVGYENDSFIESAVVDVYSKCGSINDAEKAFQIASHENLAAWNSMVMEYAHNGHYVEVIELFNEMSELGIKPDEITYLGVLKSCCYAGLVNEAYSYLNSMYELHGVTPCLEHYACMIDLLGRLGLLQDARRIIDKMPVCPDAWIWQILSSACVIHKNVDLGKVAARKLLELQPENDSAYVLLSNLYASVGMWTAAGTLRRVMREKTVHKEPASSWLSAKEPMHQLCASELSKVKYPYERMMAASAYATINKNV